MILPRIRPAALGLLVLGLSLASCSNLDRDSEDRSSSISDNRLLSSGKAPDVISVAASANPTVTVVSGIGQVLSASVSGGGQLTVESDTGKRLTTLSKVVSQLSFDFVISDAVQEGVDVSSCSFPFHVSLIPYPGGIPFLKVRKGGLKSYEITGNVNVVGNRTIDGHVQSEAQWGNLSILMHDGGGSLTLTLPAHPNRPSILKYQIPLSAG